MIVEFDNSGRMKYNPEFHSKTGEPWNKEDLEYLINWYDIIGANEMSFALERTEATIQFRVCCLRKQGLMKKPLDTKKHRRTRRVI